MKGRALLAWNLRRLRAERGVSQERLAADAAVDRAYVSELERKQANPTVDLLDKLAGVLGVSLAAFFQAPQPGDKRPIKLKGGRPPKAKTRSR